MSADDARTMGDALGRVVARVHDVTGFFEATGSVLRRSIPFDGFCSMTVDPATMLLTSHIAHVRARYAQSWSSPAATRLPAPRATRIVIPQTVPADR